MDTIIVYSSRYGSTERCAFKLKEKLYNSYIYNLNSEQKIDLKSFKKAIIGSPINIGRIHKSVRKFLQKYEEELTNKKLYLFVTAIDEEAIDKISDDIPESLRDKFIFKSNFGGKIVKSELKGIEKTGIEMIEKETGKDFTNYNSISEDKIEEFANEVNKK
ncbi:MAG TPA: flavodoxin domain-containing protein [Spirochaetota bacterium]|nr:flavodoxin domain-containing protein [Spirochaetota bacterium]